MLVITTHHTVLVVPIELFGGKTSQKEEVFLHTKDSNATGCCRRV